MFYRRLILVFGLLSYSLGFSQDIKSPVIDNSANPLLWTYMETVHMIDSLNKAHPITYWSGNNRFSVDFHEVSFQNWSAGGSNSVSFLFNIYLKRTYEKDDIRWQNEFITQYGISAEKGRKLRKTDDRLEINSTFGYRSSKQSNWFYSAKINFKTQFDRGYNYPNREYPISSFMAPAYLFTGVGSEYGKDSDTFTFYLSPATLKTTFVRDQRLADEGAFGVDKAILDDEGNVLRHGKKSASEFGFLLNSDFNKEIFNNVTFSNRVNLYTDYVQDFGNFDIDWKIDFNFRVNDYIAARIGSHLLYNDEVKTDRIDAEGNSYKGGAKVQWKQELGIGFVIEI